MKKYKVFAQAENGLSGYMIMTKNVPSKAVIDPFGRYSIFNKENIDTLIDKLKKDPRIKSITRRRHKKQK